MCQVSGVDPNSNRPYTYDAAGRSSGRVYPTDAPVTIEYDEVGNQTEVADGTGTSVFTYDELNRVKTVTDPMSKKITYSYDNAGRRKTTQTPGGTFTYTSDGANRLSVLTNPQIERTTYTYDALGRETQKQFANNSKVTHAYDAAGRVTGVSNVKSAGQAINTFAYEYDDVGNRTKSTENGGAIVYWTYDKNYRLTSEKRTGSNSYTSTFTYDANGNRLTLKKDGATTTFTYDGADQLTESEDASGTTTYTYDKAGNLTNISAPSSQKTTNTWNDENRRTRTQTPAGGDVESVYRYDGLRYEKQDSSGTTRFIYDGQNYLFETTTGGSIVVAYTVEPRTYGNLASRRASSSTRYYHTDALGSTRSLTNSSQTVTDTYLYDAWGDPITSSGSLPNPFRWVGDVGYYYDEEAGTYYVRARTYSPGIARWLSYDPLYYPLATLPRVGPTYRWRKHVNSAGMLTRNACNLQQYLVSRPINGVDPTGLQVVNVHSPLVITVENPFQNSESVYVRPLNEFDGVNLLQQLMTNCRDFRRDVYRNPDKYKNLHPALKHALECGVKIECHRSCGGNRNLNGFTPVAGKNGWPYICLKSQAGPVSSFEALLIHEAIHIRQIFQESECVPCQRRDPAPNFLDCNECQSLERPAYREQAEHLYPAGQPDSVDFYDAWVEAGVCQSCATACGTQNCPDYPEIPFPL